MNYLLLKGTRRLVLLAIFMWQYAEADRKIFVHSKFLDCVKGLQSDDNAKDGELISRIKLLSAIKHCPARVVSLENLLNAGKILEIKTVFTADKIVLFFENEHVVLSRNSAQKSEKQIPKAERFAESATSKSTVSAMKSSVLEEKKKMSASRQMEEQLMYPDGQLQYPQRYADGPQQYDKRELPINLPEGPQIQRKPSEVWQPYPPPPMASISGTAVDMAYQFFDFLWTLANQTLKQIINYASNNECLELPAVDEHFPGMYVRFDSFRLCGLANARLWPMTKTMGPDYWNATVIAEFRSMTMTFGSFMIASPHLPWPFSKINAEAIQFHFDAIYLQTSLIIPFEMLIIPTTFHVSVAQIDNFRVNFLTPNPSVSQILFASSMEKGARFVLEHIFQITSSIGFLPGFITQFINIIKTFTSYFI